MKKPFELTRDSETDWLVGPDGCDYANEHQVYHYGFLHLCGCGSPKDAYNFCRDVLALCDRRNKEWIDAEAAVAQLIASKPDVAAHTILHLLTHLDLLEHGGNVGGSWPTDDGYHIVDLRAAMEEDFGDD